MTSTGNPLLSPGLFVGRERDLAEVADLAGQGRSILLVGGRRVGKTTLVRQLLQQSMPGALVYTDAAGWDVTSEASALGALHAAVERRPETARARATREQVRAVLEAVCPLTVVIDEADRLLREPWAASFFSFLRWLDDSHLHGDISFILVGGPALTRFRDPDDKGSPPLNTAELRYLEPLDDEAVDHLTALAGTSAAGRVMEIGGGNAWLTTRLLAEVWTGRSLEASADLVFDRSVGTFHNWQNQLGAACLDFVRRFPAIGLTRAQTRNAPWSQFREAAGYARCVGVLRFSGDRLLRGPRLFFDWLSDQDPDVLLWDLAISYATEDEPLARQLNAQMRDQFKVFFAPEASVDLWGTDLYRVLPNVYGVRSRFVLVLSTPDYVRKHWTRIEFDAAARRYGERILLVDMGELPEDRPAGLVHRGSSPGEMVGLVAAIRRKLGTPGH